MTYEGTQALHFSFFIIYYYCELWDILLKINKKRSENFEMESDMYEYEVATYTTTLWK